MGRHPAADAALFLCVFGRWVGCAYLGDGSRCPALRGASSALPEESRSGRSGAETGRVVVQARGSWQRDGARGGGGQQDDARRGWRRGGEGAEVGGGVLRVSMRLREVRHRFRFLPALVPRRPSAPLASLRSFNRFRSCPRSGARPPASRPRWPVSAPVPAPALFLWHVPFPAPGASRSRSRLLSPLHSGRPLLPYLRKKNSGPPKRGVRS